MGTTFESENQEQEVKMENLNEKPSIVTISKKEVSSEKESFWHINKKALPFKMHFFFFIGGMGAALPFQSVLGITRFGLTASNLAAAYTTQQVLFLLFKPGIGYLADYFNKLKATIIGLTIIHTVFYFFMIIIPETEVKVATQSYESNNSLNDPYNCLVCDFYHDFSTVTSNLSIEEETVLRTCLQHAKNFETKSVELQCFQKNNLHTPNLNIHLLYASCNDSFFKDLLLSDNFSLQPEGSLVNILYVNQTLDGKQSSTLACISPKRMSLIDIYSDNILNGYCRHISVFPKLTENYQQSQPEVEKCLSSMPYVKESDRMAALSAANFKTYQFWVFSFCLIVSCTAASSIFTISDTACYESVSVQGGDYGRQRAWGAISWGLIAPFAGFLNDYMNSYMSAWCLMVVLFLLEIWNLSKMDLVKPDFSGSILKDIKKILSSLEFLAFELGVLMNGMFTGVIWFYLSWYLTTIGGNKLVVGLAHTVQCFGGEVPAMFVSGWMIKKLGHFNIVSLALIGHGIRFFAYSYIRNPWLVLPLECIHGLTFGSFYSAMTSYGKLNSKPGTEATTQSVLCTTYEALGAGLGCLIAGICFDEFGISGTFYYASYLCVLTTFINVIFTIVVNCRQGELKVTKSSVNERY